MSDFCLLIMFVAPKQVKILICLSVLKTLFLRHLDFLKDFTLRN